MNKTILVLIGLSCAVITAAGCSSVKTEPTGQLQQTTPDSERQSQIKEFIRQLKEEDSQSLSFIRAYVIIGDLDVKEAIPELMSLLDDEDKCLAAMGTLRRLNAKEAIPKIMTLLNDKSSRVRFDAACALGALGAKDVAIPELIKLLNDESISVRFDAACALGDLGVKDVAIPELIKLLKTTGERISSSLYISTARALVKLNARESIPELIKLLTDERRDIRRAAGDALGELDDREAIPELAKLPMIIDEDSIYGRTDSLWSHKQALIVNPKDSSAYYHMGFIYDERFDNPSKAIACYQKYLELASPDAPDRKRVERWIENCKERMNNSPHPEQSPK